MDDLCPPQTILASDTSGLCITDIAALMRRPERAITTHCWNPSHLMPLVEVIQGQHTSEETVQRVYHFLARCGKQPVIGRRDLPGQICGRLFQAMIREAIYMVQEGITTAEGVDTAIKAGVGARTGQGFYDWRARSVDDLRCERDLFLVERIKSTRQSLESDESRIIKGVGDVGD